MFRLTLFAVLLAVVAATKINECQNGVLPTEVRIKNCDSPPCAVIKGTNAEFEIDFTAIKSTTKMTSKVKATALGVTVPYPLPDDIASVCSHLLNGQKCPLDADEDCTYKFLFPVGKLYPEIGVNVEISISDENNEIVTCFNVDIKVQS